MHQFHYQAKKSDKSIMQLPLYTLNKMLILAGLAFFTGVFLTLSFV